MLRGRPHQDHRESNRYGRHQPAKDMHPLDSANEAARLSALHSLDLLDTPPEPAFDSLVQLAALAPMLRTVHAEVAGLVRDPLLVR